jgi:membrane-bound lytic murein transglycosylase B
VEGVRRDALARGIRPEILDIALGDLTEALPVVIERDRAQPEAVLSVETYIERRLTPTVVRTGREMLAKYRTMLRRVSEAYGVPPSIIVAIWGLESNYGRFTGVRPTIASLATLAWDPRRAAFFREELLKALEILDRGDISFPEMQGSWAGAMGQPQFMPSSYLQYAVDFDGDGRRNIWTSHADIFASVANYLKGYGWVPGHRWGRHAVVSAATAPRVAEVQRRDTGCRAQREMTVRLPLEEWQRLGLRLPGGRPLPTAAVEASLVSGSARHFLVYENYDVLLGYNCAHAYALSVALLSERIG